ncbi:MAG: TetR/AcrR family transcriptional regulator [Arthrobacter sp.]|uniref:TetR/AcrR family transcriptional regulator n=1 Tax=Arthrobacter sp. 179 TaxID=3457734 RepID=UPI002653DDA4|nr:TetR/AcrR family transcriptional regulator C-terminal domain-containing protein [Micrococcaceae bacterium]MDN5825469.1 TetR/AcrR family transcriptional regulator C-terminal domain-containing protein [Micrococcaceae bacterium]MDN5880669.1 TetR/AcrR family transcriptional regulator C-terminal domain-containing protein [Micrococcaceae bacterium]MDN5888037.1 TetR/AcrR family transcriptional regulator C-terminal domain-containing protein [Micrococcaceae bacterium]MDN5906633.1 TetR/AcrR family tra
MAPETAPSAVERGRAPLSRELILDTGAEFIEEHGLRRLTMRRLGQELRVEAMALYRYVPSREDLLDGVVERILMELQEDPDVFVDPRQGWQDYLVRLAHGLRKLAVAYPQVFPILATRPTGAPWIRPPLRSLAWIESFLAALTSSGFSDRDAADAYQSFSSFLLGNLLLHVSLEGEGTQPESAAQESHGVDLGGYPNIHRMQTLLAESWNEQEFDMALQDVLNRIELLNS